MTKETKPASRLGSVRGGRLARPIRLLAYGSEGTGKTTLAASAPKPICLDVEDGSWHVDVERYIFRDEDGGHVPLSYADIIGAIDDLTNNPHEFRTLIIDTVDRVESLLWKHVCERESKVGKRYDSIEDFGFGKGYVMAVDEWRALCARLDRLKNARKMNVILLGHAQVKTFKDPAGPDYDRYSLRLDQRAAGFLREWADACAFMCFDEGGGKLKGEERVKGWHTGRRLMKFERTAAYDAKSRLSLPGEIEVDAVNPWRPLANAIAASEDPAELRTAIEAEVTRIGDPALPPKVAAKVDEAKDDAVALSRILNALKQKPAAQAA